MEDRIIFSLIEVGTTLVEIALIALYSRRITLIRQVSRLKCAMVYALFFIPLVFLSFASIAPWIRMTYIPWIRISYSFIGITFLYWICYDIDLPNSIYITAVFLILSIVSDILCSYCVGLLGIPYNGVSGSPTNRVAYNAIAKLIHLILIQIFPYFLRTKQPKVSFTGTIPLLTAQFSSLIICLCLYDAGVSSGIIAIKTIIGVVATLYVNIVICFYIEVIGIKNDLAREKEVAEREYQHKLKYYESIKQSQEETRSLWHEMQRYMHTIRTLVDCGENCAAAQSMKETEQIFDGLTVTVDVGNSIINSILSIGLQQSKQHHIPFHVDAWVAPDLGVAPQDLFIILGNAIDNAIEECCQLPPEQEPCISVSIHQKGKLLAIDIENPCRLQQTPKPGKIHGYGLKNVKRCVEKYNGELQATNQEGVYHFFVLLNMTSNS